MKFSTAMMLTAATLNSASAQLYPNTTSTITTNAKVSVNSTYVPPPCLTISQMRSFIPPCALSCQLIALAADKCAFEDTACHCANTAAIEAVVAPCLANSTCSTVEVNAFANIVIGTCTYFNATTNGTMPASCSADESYGYGYGYVPPAPKNMTTTLPVKPSAMPIYPKPTGFSVVPTMNGTAWTGAKPLTYYGSASTAGQNMGFVFVIGVVASMILL